MKTEGFKKETNPQLMRKVYKQELVQRGKLHCSYCTWNGGENGGHAKHRKHTCWKKQRKTKYRRIK